MGMYDNIQCDVPLPDGWQPSDLQSKDLACELDHYTITANGRLIRKYVSGYEDVPEAEWAYKNSDGLLEKIWHEASKKRKIYSVCDMNYHGILNFYSMETPGNKWHEYRAKFTDGNLVTIEVVEA